MTQQHPITPSDKLIGEWIDTDEGGPNVISRIATRAAQWGANQELEACCEWLNADPELVDEIRAARRPKPPSLKEQALEDLDSLIADLANHGMWFKATNIRRALEQLPDHE
jgi:hypothetical protein